MLSSAKYCSNQCKWRAHKRKVYEQRRQRGQCTQCGGAMIKKNERSYCESCKDYFKCRYLKERTDDCPALIVSERHPIRRLTNEGIQYQVKKIRLAANIDKPLHPHIMRHTFAQLSLDNGMELADLQALMGHEKADTTARYAQISEERKQTAFKRFHAQ